MFIELEPIFNNVGSSKKFSYSFVPDGIDFTDNPLKLLQSMF